MVQNTEHFNKELKPMEKKKSLYNWKVKYLKIRMHRIGLNQTSKSETSISKLKNKKTLKYPKQNTQLKRTEQERPMRHSQTV